MNQSVRVIKVGGSLLTWPGLRDQLPQWLDTLPPKTNLLIFGGGECVEAMRELDALWSLNPTAMHWRCVRLLDATFEIACELWPMWRSFPQQASRTIHDKEPLFHLAELKVLTQSTDTFTSTIIVQTSSVYTRDVDTLPHHWATTTDSIAAFVANELKASELFLLKSASLQSGFTLEQAAVSGFVDEAFPSVAHQQMRIVSVELTAPNWPTTELQTSVD